MKSAKRITQLNCVDKALLAFDSSGEPMVFHWVLTVDNAVDPDKLKSAVMTVLCRHLSMRAIIRMVRFRQVREVQDDPDSIIFSVWDPVASGSAGDATSSQIAAWYEKRLSEWMNKPLNPAKELPCRVLLLRKTPAEFSVVFTFHHCSADGLRAIRFIREVIEEHNNGVAGRSAPSRYPETSRRGDEVLELAQARRLTVNHFYLKMIASLLRWFFLAPFSPPARIFHGRLNRSAESCFCEGSLSPSELRQIQYKAKSVGASLNDILLAACFRAIERWNKSHGKCTRKVSIMVPVDIGGDMSPSIISNQVSYISVSTTRKERADPEKLLRAVKHKTSHLLNNGIAFSIIYLLSFWTRFPPLVPRVIAKLIWITRIYVDTVVLTNLGLVWPRGIASAEETRIGDARVTDVTALPPIASPMGMGLGTCIYNKHLTVALVYKVSHFTKEQAKMFLDMYLAEIRSYQPGLEVASKAKVRYRERAEALH